SVTPALVPGPAAPPLAAAPVAPALVPAPAVSSSAAVPVPPAAPVPSGSAATNVAVAAPTDVSPTAAPVVAPVMAPDLFDVGRKLQRELLRVGCGVGGIETNGIWGAASRGALQSFNERTRSVAVIERPTAEALETVRGHKERVCPITCEPGTELRGGACVAI